MARAVPSKPARKETFQAVKNAPGWLIPSTALSALANELMLDD